MWTRKGLVYKYIEIFIIWFPSDVPLLCTAGRVYTQYQLSIAQHCSALLSNCCSLFSSRIETALILRSQCFQGPVSTAMKRLHRVGEVIEFPFNTTWWYLRHRLINTCGYSHRIDRCGCSEQANIDQWRATLAILRDGTAGESYSH